MKVHRPLINYDLAFKTGLGECATDGLEALHYAMEVLKSYHIENGPWDAKQQEHMLFVVHQLEYMMQDKWGFTRSMRRHTHYRDLDIDDSGYNSYIVWDNDDYEAD